jgi:hypothetical protein
MDVVSMADMGYANVTRKYAATRRAAMNANAVVISSPLSARLRSGRGRFSGAERADDSAVRCSSAGEYPLGFASDRGASACDSGTRRTREIVGGSVAVFGRVAAGCG